MVAKDIFSLESEHFVNLFFEPFEKEENSD
jgi:hypothetical protein